MKTGWPRDLFDVEAFVQRFLLANSNAPATDEYAAVRRWIYGYQIDDSVVAVIIDGTPVRLARDPYRFDMPIRFFSETPGVDEWLLAGGRLLRIHQQSWIEVVVEPAKAAIGVVGPPPEEGTQTEVQRPAAA